MGEFYEHRIVKVADLIPYALNSRTHSDEQVAQLAASIREFGFTNPVLIDEQANLIAGHGRLLAARKLKMEQVPAVVVTGLDDRRRRALVIADNKLALNAGWDEEALRVELEDLATDFGELMGFSQDELVDLLKKNEVTEGLTDEDAVPEVPEEPITREGDVWLLGRHRIVCGDATNPSDWDKLLIGDGFVLFTSPPYNTSGSSKLSGNKKSSERGKFYDKFSDDLSSDEYAELLAQTMSTALPHVQALMFNVQPLAGAKRALLKWMNGVSSNLVDVMTWDKGHAAPHIQPGIMASRFEWLVLLSREENASRVVPFSSWQGKFSNVYQAPPQRKNEFASVHGATFPVHLPEFVIGDLMNRCRGVVDCFLGTGTTIIAAEKLGRDGRGIELSPAYVDVAVKRWQDYTGQQATLEATGQTYDQLAVERKAA
ncbi:MAG: site-specific DNA-methyltransferase [Candidatus Limnocylindrus sp.]